MSTPTPQSWTVTEITLALERLGFAVQPPLKVGADNLDYVTGLLAAAPTAEDCAQIQKWLDERRDAFNEDLARILLGDFCEGQADTPAECLLEHLLRRGRPLAAELAELAGKLEGEAGGRIRAIAAELTQLFAPAQTPSSLASEAGQVLLPLAGDAPPDVEGMAGYQNVLHNQQIDVGSQEAA
jgi:hypothetical protein